MTRIMAAVFVSAALSLTACSDEAAHKKAEPDPAADSPTAVVQQAPAPVPPPTTDAPEPPAADMPIVDPTAEPVDPDSLMQLRPD